ncbi:MAG: glycosyl transferase family 2 [Prevotella sp.]|nr:glycosyl transferase family 2 [Prevotella sp.]
MRILAVVILYNPDLQLLQENIGAFTSHVETTMVWDNSPKEISMKNEQFAMDCFPQVIYKGDGYNRGISFGLNKAWEYARKNQYDVLLTMDQDSIFSDFKEYKQRVITKWQSEGLCACGPTPNISKDSGLLEDFSQSPRLITSGMLIPVPLLNACGGYCADYHIDGIDVELCYHLNNLGFQTFIDNKSNLSQRFGQQVTRKIPFFGDKTFSNYNPSRLYEIFRNHIITWRRYHYPRNLSKLIFYEYFISYVIKDVIILGKGKGKKLRAVFKGVVDGFWFPV